MPGESRRIWPAAGLVLAAGLGTAWLAPAVGGRGGALLAWIFVALGPLAAAGLRGHALDASLSRLLLGLFATGLLSRFLGLDLIAGSGVGLGLIALLVLAPPRREPITRSRIERFGLGLAAALLAVWMVVQPPGVGLHTDVPAHLAGLHDALEHGRWQPHSWIPGEGWKPDIRFGVLHGWMAALAELSGSDPWEVLRLGPTLAAPLFLVALHLLARALGLPWPIALASAMLATILGEGGRGSGLWASIYPGTLVLAVGWLALARWLGGARQEAALLLAASAAVHPFAWVAAAILAAHAFVALLVGGQREVARRAMLPVASFLALGVLVLLPALRLRPELEGAIHAAPTDVLLWGAGLFTADPLALMRWASPAALLSAPVSLLAWMHPRWRTAVPGLGWALLLSLPTWTIALDPLLAPLAWEGAGYLVVRLGRLLPPFLLVGLLVAAVHRHGRPGRLPLVLAAAIALAALGARPWPSPARGASEPWSWTAPVLSTPGGVLASDPRSSYALRSSGLRQASTYPVAHASPLDTELPARLAAWRMLVTGGGEAWREALDRLHAEVVWWPRREEELYGDGEWGYHPRPEISRARLQELEDAGARPLHEDPAGALFSVSELASLELRPRLVATPPPGPALPSMAGPGLPGPLELVGATVAGPPLKTGGQLLLELEWEHDAGLPGLVEVVGEGSWPRVRVQLVRVGAGGWRLFRLLASRGRDSQRFAKEFTPFDGFPAVAGPGGRLRERRALAVPAYVRPGEYEMWLSAGESGWRPVRRLASFMGAGPRPGAVRLGKVRIDAMGVAR